MIGSECEAVLCCFQIKNQDWLKVSGSKSHQFWLKARWLKVFWLNILCNLTLVGYLCLGIVLLNAQGCFKALK